MSFFTRYLLITLSAFILAIPLTYFVRWGVIHIFELAEIPLNASTRLRLHDSSEYLFLICFVLLLILLSLMMKKLNAHHIINRE